jgi:UDP:flavonoid glycosyltransferase YjiC (YdhE family)
MRILFSSTRGAGHFGPLVPFARAALDAGHDIVVACPDEAVPLVTAAGFETLPFTDPPKAETVPVHAAAQRLDTDAGNALVIRELFGRIDATTAMPRLLATVDEFAPDLIVRESCEYASHVAAEMRAIPEVRVAIGMIALEELMMPHAAAGLAQLRADVGLPADLDGKLMLAKPQLTTRPAALDPRLAPRSRELHRFREAAAPAGLPARLLPAGDGPLVHLSFGSVAPTAGFFPGLYRAAIDAIAGLDVRVLVTVGSACDPAELGPVPSNVRVAGWVSQQRVMAYADAMITHGGSGSTTIALSAGVPLVIVPLFADQPYNAQHIASLGAGIALEGGPAAVAGLSDALAELLFEPRYRVAAEQVAAEVAELPPVDAAVDLLEELAGVAV